MRTVAKSLIKPQKVDWVAVADQVSEKLGQRYAANYCRDIAKGYRNSSVVAPILQGLGVMARPKQSQRARTNTPSPLRAVAA